MESDERVILIAPTYYKELAEVLHNEPKRNLANLMMWKAAKGSISYLNKAARDTIEDYVKKLSGKKIDTPRWKTCTATAAGSFSAAVGKLYVQKHFQEDAKESMMEMVRDIKDEFRHILNEVYIPSFFVNPLFSFFLQKIWTVKYLYIIILFLFRYLGWMKTPKPKHTLSLI